MGNRRARWILSAVVAVLAAFLLFVLYYPAGKKKAPPIGYTPIRDDALAARYQPLFDCPAQFGPILAVYYRAAKDESGIIHIAYHPLWAKEENNAPGLGAFLSRYLYTGGLSLQRLMFGPGDIEAIGLAIDPKASSIVQIDYETAAHYDPSSFSVTHKAISQKGNFAPPLRFAVVSWNHLFALEGQGGAGSKAPVPQTGQSGAAHQGPASQTEQVAAAEAPESSALTTQAPLSYFTSALWNRYGIWKNPQTILRKDRAHFVWERGAAE